MSCIERTVGFLMLILACMNKSSCFFLGIESCSKLFPIQQKIVVRFKEVDPQQHLGFLLLFFYFGLISFGLIWHLPQLNVIWHDGRPAQKPGYLVWLSNCLLPRIFSIIPLCHNNPCRKNLTRKNISKCSSILLPIHGQLEG